MEPTKTNTSSGEVEPEAKVPPPDANSEPETDAAVQCQLQAVLTRARGGDASVLPQLKKILDANPELWQTQYQLISLAEQLWLDKIAGQNLLLSQSIRHYIEQLKRDVARPNPSPLEKLLAERVVLCWLAVHHAELSEATADSGGLAVA